MIGSATGSHAVGFVTESAAIHLYAWGSSPHGMVGVDGNPITTPTRIVAR